MMKKRNMAVAMAAVTVATTVAPAFANTLDGTVISVKDEAQMNALKAEIKGYLDTKYDGELKNNYTSGDLGETAADGESAYKIMVSVNGGAAAEVKTLKALQTELDKLTSISDSLKITVTDKGHKEVDGKIVNWKTEAYKNTDLDGVVTAAKGSDFISSPAAATDIVKSVEKTNADTVTIELKNNKNPLVIKTGDDKLNIAKANVVYSMNEYGKYLDKEGKVIVDATDANAATHADTVVLGFDKLQFALEDTDQVKEKSFEVTYSNAFGAVTKYKVADLFEMTAGRYTNTGNKLANFIAEQRTKGNVINIAEKDANTITIGIEKNPAVLETRTLSAANYANIEITGTDKEIDTLGAALGVGTDTLGTPEVEILAGSNRVNTAIEVSKDQFASATDVVLVSDYAIADGLAATPFAAMKNAPILLTNKDKASDEVIKEIKRLGATKVHVIGGEAAISEGVVDQLEANYLSVERIKGKNREATSLEIAKLIDAETSHNMTNVYVAGGRAEADTMSISAIAANENLNGNKVAPIILTGANGLSEEQSAWLKQEAMADAVIVGGEAAVPANVEAQLEEIGTVERVKGKNRQDTNAKVVAKYFMSDLNDLYVADANKGLVDALAGGVAAAKNNAPIVLVGEDISAEQKSVLDSLTNKDVDSKKQIGYNVSLKAMETLKKMITKN